MKANDDRIRQAVTDPDVHDLVLWWAFLDEETDPIRTGSEPGGRSADPPLPHEPGMWIRAQQRRIVEQIRRLTLDIQQTLKVPVEQRTVVDTTGRCPMCGRHRRPPTRSSSTTNSTGQATYSQHQRIAQLADQFYGSIVEMEKQIGVTVATLNRSEATRLVRMLKG